MIIVKTLLASCSHSYVSRISAQIVIISLQFCQFITRIIKPSSDWFNFHKYLRDGRYRMDNITFRRRRCWTKLCSSAPGRRRMKHAAEQFLQLSACWCCWGRRWRQASDSATEKWQRRYTLYSIDYIWTLATSPVAETGASNLASNETISSLALNSALIQTRISVLEFRLKIKVFDLMHTRHSFTESWSDWLLR